MDKKIPMHWEVVGYLGVELICVTGESPVFQNWAFELSLKIPHTFIVYRVIVNENKKTT